MSFISLKILSNIQISDWVQICSLLRFKLKLKWILKTEWHAWLIVFDSHHLSSQLMINDIEQRCYDYLQSTSCWPAVAFLLIAPILWGFFLLLFCYTCLQCCLQIKITVLFYIFTWFYFQKADKGINDKSRFWYCDINQTFQLTFSLISNRITHNKTVNPH